MSTPEGTLIECGWGADLDSVRRTGLPSEVGAGCLTVRRPLLKGVKNLTVRATLTLGVPRDIERTVMDRLLGKVELLGGSIALEKLAREEGGRWDVKIDGEGGREPFTVLLSVEDAAGRWLGDLHTLALTPGGSRGISSSSSRLGEGIPARGVVTRVVGEDEIKVPFTLSGIPPPRSSGD